MESYFFHINIHENIDKNIVLEHIRQNFNLRPNYTKIKRKIIFNKVIYENNRFILDDTLIIEAENIDNKVVVSIEGCFANYQPNLKKSYEVYKIIKSKNYNVVLSVGNHKVQEKGLIGFERFCSWLKQIFENKYNNFERLYGKLNITVLPHEFYDYIKRNKSILK
ncbi:MAG TPA: hypothetical protein GXZ48_00060 [Acholeplasmataceae bacterium]|nr:hypothetical protein [Acholeplasmataceae bacterium]